MTTLFNAPKISKIVFIISIIQATFSPPLHASVVRTHHSTPAVETTQNNFKTRKSGRKQTTEYNDFENNPYTSSDQKKRLRPYLLPANHPIKPALDKIFKTQRATATQQAFTDAGFTTIATQPRSFIVIGRHPLLPGYLVKAYLDTEKRDKRGKPGWHWLANRCKGAEKVQKAIEKYGFTKFTVPKKWIYPLPLNPPPYDTRHERKYNEVLIVEDMNLADQEVSLQAWKNIGKANLRALYQIFCLAGGSSYREDNIPYTKDGKFAFIDTEYPDKVPNFNSILPYLSPEMQTYWRKLVRKGGAY